MNVYQVSIILFDVTIYQYDYLLQINIILFILIRKRKHFKIKL